MPGHSRAAIRAMEVRHARLTATGKTAEANEYRLIDPADTTEYRSIQNYDDNTLNVCLPATYRFVDTVVDALAAMHKEAGRSEEHTSELQSLMRISYAVFCLKKKKYTNENTKRVHQH